MICCSRAESKVFPVKSSLYKSVCHHNKSITLNMMPSVSTVLEMFRGLSWCGFTLACITLAKLLMIGKNLNFMNFMFISILLVEIISGVFIIPNFFTIGQENWKNEDPQPEKLMGPCGLW